MHNDRYKPPWSRSLGYRTKSREGETKVLVTKQIRKPQGKGHGPYRKDHPEARSSLTPDTRLVFNLFTDTGSSCLLEEPYLNAVIEAMLRLNHTCVVPHCGGPEICTLPVLREAWDCQDNPHWYQIQHKYWVIEIIWQILHPSVSSSSCDCPGSAAVD